MTTAFLSGVMFGLPVGGLIVLYAFGREMWQMRRELDALDRSAKARQQAYQRTRATLTTLIAALGAASSAKDVEKALARAQDALGGILRAPEEESGEG